MSMREMNEANRILQDHILKRYENQSFQQEWRNLPEIPSKAEICPPDKALVEAADEVEDSRDPRNWNKYQEEPSYDQNLPHNIVDGPWPSKEEYLGAHYQILREDAIAPLRRAVASFKKCPALEDDNEICVYTDVTLKGLVLSKIGVGFRIEFAPRKQIKWESSKRLLQGGLVALSSDNFKTECKIATVVGRGLDLLEQNPPAIEIFWGDSEDAEIDPVKKYVMLESREGYFESSRHVLVAMQKLMTEKFQLQNHIVGLDRDIKAPQYIENQPFVDLSSLQQQDEGIAARDADPDQYINVNVLRDFPKDMNSGMDRSQMLACEKMLTNRIAIVQGPPGTGKTFTSVSTLKVMIENLRSTDSALIVAAQTNHALDQLLNHILTFETNILRLGGRSNKANEEILKRTLFELRTNNTIPGGTAGFRQARIQFGNCSNNILAAVASLETGNMLTAEELYKQGLISEAQLNSLSGNPDWEGDDSGGDIAEWLTEGQMMPVPETPPINLGLAVEQTDLDFEEEVADIDNEFKVDAADQEKKLDDREGLKGDWLPFKRKVTGRHSHPPTLSDKKIKQKLASSSLKNLYDIPLANRGEFYRYFEKEMNKIALRELKGRLKEYQHFVNSWGVTRHMSNIKLVRHLGIKVIGCTTTGLSKYRSLLSALKPRILLIEEAAETLEANVVGGLMDSIEHLVLVGDHQQLRAQCTVRALEDAPYHMNVSMFERLINNSIAYVMLNVQRRMIQDVRKLLCIEPAPFYKDLRDHPSVLDRLHTRPPVPGMGGLDTYFFHHTWPEATNAECSRFNIDEAQMIARFFLYLCHNGVDPNKITVLTFYNGQKATILQELKKLDQLKHVRPFKVFTVDSYQGEENDIILLSLVRSNFSLSIGFLDSRNRLVVALSRARRGLYLFGNAVTLAAPETSDEVLGRDPLWYPVIQHMIGNGRFNVDGGLPVTCSKHGKVTKLYDATHFDQVLSGGCDKPCGGTLPCGHPCETLCHPLDHRIANIQCQQACKRELTCGCKCSKKCGEQCYCLKCCLYDGQVHVLEYDWGGIDMNGNVVNSAWGDGLRKSAMKGSLSEQDLDKRVKFVPATIDGHANPRLRPHTPTRLGPLYANDLSPRSRGTMIRKSSPTTWQKWDAKKADEQLARERRLEDALGPKIDQSQLIFKEKFVPTGLNKSGQRIYLPSGPLQRQLPRRETEFEFLDVVLADKSILVDLDVDLSPKKAGDLPESLDLRSISPTELPKSAKKKVQVASSATNDVVSLVSSLSIRHSVSAGENLQFRAVGEEIASSSSEKRENVNGCGRSGANGSSRGIACRGGPAGGRGSSRGSEGFKGRGSTRGNSSRGSGTFRGRGSFRGAETQRGRVSDREQGSGRGRAQLTGRPRESSSAQEELVGDLLGLDDDDLPSSSHQATPTDEADNFDLYDASPPRYQSVWGVNAPALSGSTANGQHSTGCDEVEKLIDFD